MADTVYSHAGDTLAISTTAANSDLDQSGFEALTYTSIAAVGSVGEYGINTNALEYDTWNTVVALKAKGISNAGNPEVEAADTPTDTGQQAMDTAGAPGYADNHAFKHTKQSGAVVYLRGLVAGPRWPNGRNEGFDLKLWLLMLQQVPVDVAPSV